MAQSLAQRGSGTSRTRRPQTSQATPVFWHRSGIQTSALLLLAALVYLPALRAGFIWDDDDYVTHNLTLRSLDGLRRIWFELGATPQYYPLVHSTFWLEFRLWRMLIPESGGLWAAGFHFNNVVLHACSAALLFGLLRRLTVPGAWLAAALFAVHPVHVESVVWITERKNVLSGVLYLGALWSYLRYLSLRGEEAFPGFALRTDRWPAAWNSHAACYGLALLLFVGALLSKTVTFTLPAAVLVLLWWKRGKLVWRDVPPLLPLFAAGAALGLVTVWMEKHTVGAQGDEWSLQPVERWLVAGRAIWFYTVKLVWPDPLIFVYPRWKLDGASLRQHLFPVAFFCAMGLLLILRRRFGRAPLAALLLFAGTLFPALGFFDVFPMRYSFVADHFQYLASIALITLAAAGLTLAGRQMAPFARVTGMVLLLAAAGGVTWKQSLVYHDLESLWRDTLAKNPAASIAHNNLGNLLTERGDFAEAQTHYAAALTLDARDDFAHYNLGVNLHLQGRPSDAVERFREALRINERYVDAYFNLGRALEDLGKSREAAEAFRSGLRLRPADANAHAALAVSLVNQNLREDAIRSYEAALELAPENPDIHFNFGALLAATGKSQDAARHYETALRLRPADIEAHAALAQVYQKLGDGAKARQHLEMVRRLSVGQ